MRRRLVLLLALILAGSAAAATPVKVQRTWTGHMPLEVPPLFQSSVATADAWPRVWATCQMSGAPPEVDFAKHLVLVAVRRSTDARFEKVTLDRGNLVTRVSVAAGTPKQQTCALALVDRAGVSTVNGAAPGK